MHLVVLVDEGEVLCLEGHRAVVEALTLARGERPDDGHLHRQIAGCGRGPTNATAKGVEKKKKNTPWCTA